MYCKGNVGIMRNSYCLIKLTLAWELGHIQIIYQEVVIYAKYQMIVIKWGF